MQTFSNMRRNSTYQDNLNFFYIVCLLFAYQILTSLYMFLSPLIGVFFCYLILLKNKELKTKEEQTKEWYFGVLYLIFTELNHGFYLFSTMLFLYIFYHLVADWVQSSIKCEVCVLSGFVIFAYVGVYATNNLLSYILNKEFFIFGWEYIAYILLDCAIVSLFFRGRI